MKSLYKITNIGEGDAVVVIEMTPDEVRIVRRIARALNDSPQNGDYCPTLKIEKAPKPLA